jgi:hypothetical protein
VQIQPFTSVALICGYTRWSIEMSCQHLVSRYPGTVACPWPLEGCGHEDWRDPRRWSEFQGGRAVAACESPFTWPGENIAVMSGKEEALEKGGDRMSIGSTALDRMGARL